MPKYPLQKLKILYILDILKENTDDTHGITVKEIIKELESRGVMAERKSVYSDIELLRDIYGADIISVRKYCNTEYSLVSRDFELAEVRLLVDAVQSSRFITRKKSFELIRKLESLTSKADARSLRGQVFVANRIKTMNETIYYNVDAVNQAISENRQITFKYFEWTPQKKKSLRRNGELYRVSPQALLWDNENYYLVAFDNDRKKIRHYRVDKMLNITVCEVKNTAVTNLDTALYSKRMFGMFGGESISVTIRFDNSLAGAVIDRFGTDVMLIPEQDTFVANVTVNISPQFFGWICAFGTGAQIIGPDNIVNEFSEYVNEIAKKYNG